MVKLLFKIFLALVLFLNSCATLSETQQPNYYGQKNISDKIRDKIAISVLNKEDLATKIKRFYGVIKTGRKLNEADLKLHDELFEAYKILKYRPRNNRFHIPPYTQIVMPLHSYCLDSGMASPHEQEVFKWSKDKDSVPYLKQLLELSFSKKYDQGLIQELIWNLRSKTYWENYPVKFQEILKNIDPDVESKIPKKILIEVKETFINEVLNNVPHTNLDAQGDFQSFQNIKEKLDNRDSNQKLIEDQLSIFENQNDLYVFHSIEGFSKQDVSVYNISDQTAEINLSQYILNPLRSDVQRLAVYSENNDEIDGIFKKLEQLLYSDMARFGYGFIPVFNDLIDLYEVNEGKNFFTNEALSTTDRFLSALALLAGNAEAYRNAAKILHGPQTHMTDQFKKYRQIKNTENYKTLEKLADDLKTKGIPDDWAIKVSRVKSKSHQGIEYTHPDNDNIRIRVMPGNRNSPFKNSQKPYVIVKKEKEYYNKNGENFPQETAETHIPFDEFDFKIFKRIFTDE